MKQYSKETLSGFYRMLYRIRAFELRCVRLFRQGQIRGYLHPYLGQEAIATGVCASLEAGDLIVSTHRGHGHCIARGADLGCMMAELFGRAGGYCAGRGGSMHIADFDRGNLGANGIVGAGIPIGVGAALASQIRDDGRVTAIFFSDGASNNGVFAESLNMAAIRDLPVLFVLENNHYAVSTPIEAMTREADLYKRAAGYGVEGLAVDGNDVLEVYEKSSEMVARCRDGRGPVLMEAKTYRHMGHHANDPGRYMPKDRVEHYRSRDPVQIGAKYLMEIGGAAEAEVARITAEIDAEIAAAEEYALNSPDPSVEAFVSELGDSS